MGAAVVVVCLPGGQGGEEGCIGGRTDGRVEPWTPIGDQW